MKILVTGAAGFIGQHLVTYLAKQDEQYEIIALVHPNDAPVKQASSVIKCDLSEYSSLNKVPTDVEAVFHIAASVALGSAPESIERCLRNNILATLNVVRLCSERSVKKFIYSSSASIYKQPLSQLPVCEKADICLTTPYAVSKWVSEWIVASKEVPIEVQRIILRYSSVYGPGQRQDSVLPIFIAKVMSGSAPVLFGTGERSQDFVYVEDVCAANTLALRKKVSYSVSVYNIGSGYETSMMELAQSVLSVFDTSGKLQIEHDLSRVDSATRFVLDISKANAELGYRPLDLLSGLDKYRRSLEINSLRRP